MSSKKHVTFATNLEVVYEIKTENENDDVTRLCSLLDNNGKITDDCQL